jgi:HEPN domain-containing protein
MVRRPKTVSVSRAESGLYLAKAEQFSAEAGAALDGSRNDAAMLNAIHAAISAVDAVTAALAGLRSADPDHQRAIDLLEEVASGSDEIKTRVRQVRRLLARKNVVEYESRRATAKEARDAVERARRIVAWAAVTVRRARI